MSLRRYLSCLALLAGCTGEFADPETVTQAVLTGGQINGSGLPAKTVVLTYDDGPDDHTIELAEYLKDQGIRATFFVNGRRFCKQFDEAGKCVTPQDTRRCTNGQMQAGVTNPKYYPEAWLDMLVAMGHRIANHTQDHCHMTGQSMDDAIWEVKTTQDLLDKHICDNVYLLRAPFGEWSGTVATRINSMMGFPKIIGPINWDVDGNDWDCWQKGTSPESCANKYMSILNGRGNQNGIFLMHDRPEFNVTYAGPLLMTKILVPRLKAAGFKFATMDEVLKMAPKPIGCPNAPAMDGGATPAADAGASPDATAEPGGTGGSGPGGTGGSGPAGTGGSGTGGSTGTGGSSGAGGSKGSTGGSKGSEETGGDEGGGPMTSAGRGGGCAVGGTGSGAALPLLALVALARRFSGRRRSAA
jgi:peptidoglycan/xylan/chitin deacetylase (PgdA/CDA1 family)